jgi:hypothetical protein
MRGRMSLLLLLAAVAPVGFAAERVSRYDGGRRDPGRRGTRKR